MSHEILGQEDSGHVKPCGTNQVKKQKKLSQKSDDTLRQCVESDADENGPKNYDDLLRSCRVIAPQRSRKVLT